eukprot:scaffold13357_cov100-Isochrysis_galbana.AAC.7
MPLHGQFAVRLLQHLFPAARLNTKHLIVVGCVRHVLPGHSAVPWSDVDASGLECQSPPSPPVHGTTCPLHRIDKTTTDTAHTTTNNKNGRGHHPMKRPLQGERNQGVAP